MQAQEEYKTQVEIEFEADRVQQQNRKSQHIYHENQEIDSQLVQKEQNNQEIQSQQCQMSLIDKVKAMDLEDKILTVKNYLDYIWNGNNNGIYLPVNIITPSEIEGLTLEEERMIRIYGCEFIKEASILLKMPNIVASTAQLILHRFYYRKSFIKCDVFTVASASLFLAGKIEENPRKIKDIVSVCDYVKKMKSKIKRPIQVIDINSFQFTDLRNEIIDAERYILKELGFNVYKVSADNVHKYMYYYLKQLKATKQLAQQSWNYVNDCYRTISVVCFPPNVLATACIYLASNMINYPMPLIEWWKIFGVNADILSLYEQQAIDTQTILTIVNSILQKQKDQKLKIQKIQEQEEIIENERIQQNIDEDLSKQNQIDTKQDQQTYEQMKDTIEYERNNFNKSLSFKIDNQKQLDIEERKRSERPKKDEQKKSSSSSQSHSSNSRHKRHHHHHHRHDDKHRNSHRHSHKHHHDKSDNKNKRIRSRERDKQ